MRLERTYAPNPYDYLPAVPSFTLTSDDVVADAKLGLAHVHNSAGGENVSPQLTWEGFPPDTRSFAITCYDPDAPTGSGWWHWQVVDIPVTTTHLPRDAGNAAAGLLPSSAVQMRNDFGSFGFGGAGPPIGDHPHHYYFVVHALNVDHLGLGQDTTNAVVGFHLVAHGLARATLVATYDH